MGSGLVQTRKADAQDPEWDPREGGGLLLRMSLFLRMDAIWLITRSLAVGAVVRWEPLRWPKAGLFGGGSQNCCSGEGVSLDVLQTMFVLW